MPSYVPAKKNTELIFYMGLVSQSTGQFQANPTLAAGDCKVSKDGGALANLSTLPAVTPAASKMVKVTLSSTEMDADNVTLVFSDAAGDEWDDVIINIQTAARQIDDLATPTNITAGTITTVTNLTNAPTSGDLTATMKASVNAEVDTALSDYGALKPTVAGRTLDVAAGGEAGVDWANIGSPTTTVNLSGTTIKTATDVETDTANIQTRIPAALSGDGFMKADLKSIEDELTSGNNATLNLRHLNVTNTGAQAVVFVSDTEDAVVMATSASDRSGLYVSSNGDAVTLTGGAAGLYSFGNSSGIFAEGNTVNGIHAKTNGTHAISAESTGSGVSINAPQGITGSDSEDLSVTNIADAIPTAAENAAEVLSAAAANPIDANVQEVNDVTLTGDGSTTPWGPA
jgi:hypothetical protein